MIKIAICDDEVVFLDQIYRVTENFLKKESIPFEAHSFISGEDLVQSLENGAEYDIAFLDIQMKQISGVDVGAILRQKFNHTQTLLIYISAFDSRAKEVIYFNAIRFLSKPIDPLLFEEALCHACHLLEKKESQKFYFKNAANEQVAVPLSDIIYFETKENHRISVITSVNNYVCYGKMSDIEAQFTDAGFLRIHQAYMINFNYIKKIDYNQVIMKNDMQLFISRGRRKEIQKQYLQIREGRFLYWL